MRSTFEFYMAKLDGWPFEVGVDLAAHDDERCAKMPYRWHLRFELNHPNEDGLASAEEEALLLAIQEEIEAALPEEGCRFVAAVTHRNAHTLVIYSNRLPEDGHPILKALEGIETHTTRVLHEEDASWDEYQDVLYPSAAFLHQIKDRRILREFERQGDDCGEVHSIEPRFVGLDKDGADRLAAALQERGFGIKGIDEVGQNGQCEWQVTAAAESPLALPILDDFRQTWMTLAEEAGGRYDGWSAELIPVTGANNNTGCDGHLSGVAEDYEGAVEPTSDHGGS